MKYKRIDEVALINNNSITSKMKFDFINYLDTGNITNGKIDEIQNIKDTQYPSRAKRLVKNNDIVFSTVRPNQCHYGILKDILPNMVVSTGFAVLTSKEEIDADYLYYYLTLPAIVQKLQNIAETSTSTYPSIKPSDIGSVQIPLPDITEQKKIGLILSSISNKIELNNQVNERLQSLSQLLFKNWFVDFEFPNEEGFPYKSSGGEMVDSELGMIPKEWKVKTIEDICTIRRGASPRPIQEFMDETRDGIPWIKISDATSINTPFLLSTKEYIKLEGKNKSVYIEEGTLILSNSATPGIPKFVQFKACVHDGWLILDKYDSYYRSFIYFLLLSLRKQLVNLSNGSVFNNLKTDIVKNYKFVNPNKAVLSRFEKAVGTLMNIILHNSKEIETLITFRDTLLPKLMSGEIDLSNLQMD